MTRDQDGEPLRLGRLFVALSSRLPWLTPEYFLWRMTIGRAMMYAQYLNEKPEGKDKGGVKPVSEMTDGEATAKRDEIREAIARYKDLHGDIGDG